MPAPVQSDVSLRDLIGTLRRRKTIIIAIALFCIVVSVLLCLVKTRRYDSSSVIELQKSAGGSLGLESMMSGAGEDSSDSLGVDLDLMTQVNILQSDTLALNVIKDLHLENNRDFRGRSSRLADLMSHFGFRGNEERSGATIDNSPALQTRLLRVFKHNLRVTAIAGTRLIQVEYRNPDPQVAAAVANDLVRQLIDYSFQVRYHATTETSRWLEVQLNDLRNESTGLNSRVAAMQKHTGLFGVGGSDAKGSQAIYSPVMDRLQRATVDLFRAQSNRILKGAVYEAVKSGNPDLISELSGTSIGEGADPGVAGSLTLIQSLREQEANIGMQIQQASVQYGPSYPKLLELRAASARIQKSLQDEIDRVGERAKNDFDIAQQAEASAQKVYDEDRSAADQLNDKTVEFSIVKREADQSQDLYQDLLRRLKEAGVIEGLHASNITVVDEARTSTTPSEPDVPLYLAAGLFAGVFLGSCGGLVAESIDNRVRGADEVEALSLPVLGILPRLLRSELTSALPVAALPQSIYSEAMRNLRSTMLLSRSGAPPKLLAVTSASPAEGKSTVALNLAAVFAQSKRSVLLMEADMRRPTLKARLHLSPDSGLSELLSHTDRELAGAVVTVSDHLSYLPAGPIPPYPAELLGSDQFGRIIAACRERFDIIIIDTPPVLPVADARIVAEHADVTLLVARSDVTTRASLSRAYKLLLPHHRSTTGSAIGVIVNAIVPGSAAYYEYYGGYSYNYSYKPVETRN